MKNSYHTKAVITGIFVLLALAIFAGGILALSGGSRNIFGRAIYISTNFENVSGLKKGGNVLYDGVKVGVIKTITLLPGGGVQVVMQIDDTQKAFVPKDATVRLGNDGLVGSKVLEITGGHIKSGAITNGAVLKNGTGASLGDLFSTLQSNNNNLTEITTGVKEIVQRILAGQGTLGKLINDPSLVNDLQGMLTQFQKSAHNANTLTQNLANYTEKLEKPGTMTYNLLNDTVIFNKLRSTSTQLEMMAQQAQAVIGKLNGATDKLNDKDKPAGMFLNDEKTANDLKTTIGQLQTGTEKLNETLDALRHSIFLRRGFKKVEKEQANSQAPIHE